MFNAPPPIFLLAGMYKKKLFFKGMLWSQMTFFLCFFLSFFCFVCQFRKFVVGHKRRSMCTLYNFKQYFWTWISILIFVIIFRLNIKYFLGVLPSDLNAPGHSSVYILCIADIDETTKKCLSWLRLQWIRLYLKKFGRRW